MVEIELNISPILKEKEKLWYLKINLINKLMFLFCTGEKFKAWISNNGKKVIYYGIFKIASFSSMNYHRNYKI